MTRLGLALAITLLPAVAAARPITAGVNLGVDQSKDSGLAGEDPNDQVGLFGRIGLTGRLSAQLEISKIRSEDTGLDVRSVTGLLVVDLTASKTFVPILLVGIGADWATADYAACEVCAYSAESQSATHIEGGFGLEYRSPGGFTIGADVRMGGRSVDDETTVPLDYGRPPQMALFLPRTVDEGEYRSARLRLGIRF